MKAADCAVLTGVGFATGKRNKMELKDNSTKKITQLTENELWEYI